MKKTLLSLMLLAACTEELPPDTHRHAPLHHGLVRSTFGHRHLELKLTLDGSIEVYLLDELVNPKSNAGAFGTVALQVGDRSAIYALQYAVDPEFDYLKAKAPPLPRGRVFAIVEVYQGDERYAAHFDYDLAAKPDLTPHHHDPRHGGQLGMVGTYHIELARPIPGEYQVFLSDMMRGPISPDLAKDAFLILDPDGDAPERLALRPDAYETHLTTSGKKEAKGARIELQLGGKPLSIEFLLP